MKKSYRHQMYMGTIGDIKTLETHFALMAQQGLMIDKVGMFTHRYRVVEPCEKQFFVDLLPQITAFDYPENEDAHDYRSLCEESGWTFLAANKQLQVFCADTGAPAMPIHTDNRIQARIYLRTFLRYELFAYLIVPLLGFVVVSQVSRAGVEVFLSDLMMFQSLGFLLFLCGYLWVVGFVLSWYLRTRKSAALDLPMPAVNYRLSRIRGKFFIICGCLYVFCMSLGIALEVMGGMSAVLIFVMLIPISALAVGFWIRHQIDTIRRSRRTNILITVTAIIAMEVVFLGLMGGIVFRTLSTLNSPRPLDNRPALTLTDIGVTSAPAHTITRIDGSVLVPVHHSHWEMSNDGSVRTETYRAVGESLARLLYDHYAGGYDNYYRDSPYSELSPDEAGFWGADYGVASDSGNGRELVLLRGKTLLRVSFSGASLNEDSAVQAVCGLWQTLAGS